MFAVYCRCGTLGARLRGGNALCLASIDVDVSYRGKGFFASLVNALGSEPSLTFDRIEVESVINDRLAGWLARNGFQRFGGTDALGETGHSFQRKLAWPIPTSG
ncbi:protein of unknown function (plasmid) [Cupriavidus taiwanensis]|nr:protein of unknown function [Cupriavidus taiwanensis]